MYAEYSDIRGSIGMPREELLPINSEDSHQVCDTFGIHPKLPFLKEVYDQEEAVFMAGIGVLSEHVTQDNYESKTKTQLFAHNTSKYLFLCRHCSPLLETYTYSFALIKVQAEIARLDPFLASGNTGTLGRLVDVLSTEYSVNAFAVDTGLVALEGNTMSAIKTSVNSDIGFQKFNPSAGKDDLINTQFGWINGEQESHSNFFGQTWSASLVSIVLIRINILKIPKNVVTHDVLL